MIIALNHGGILAVHRLADSTFLDLLDPYNLLALSVLETIEIGRIWAP